MRRVVLLVLALGCGCGGRHGTYVVSEGGAPAEAGPGNGSGGASDAGADAQPDGEAGANTACIDWCNTALSVGCAQDEMNDCLLGCDDFIAQFPLCASQINAVNACAAAEPTHHWFCDTDGFAALRASYCATENTAMQDCLSSNYP